MRKTQRKTTTYGKDEFITYINKHTTPTDTYKIHKDIPVPTTIRDSARFPLMELTPAKMKKNVLVGPCFNVPMKEERAIRNAISRKHKITDYKFLTRKVIGKGKAGQLIRVWRVS